MPRGGKRIGAGRRKRERPVDGNLARKIKAKINAEAKWLLVIGLATQKAETTFHTADLRQALEYLDNRDLGLCLQPSEQKLSFDPDQPLRVTVEHIGIAHKAAAKTK